MTRVEGAQLGEVARQVGEGEDSDRVVGIVAWVAVGAAKVLGRVLVLLQRVRSWLRNRAASVCSGRRSC